MTNKTCLECGHVCDMHDDCGVCLWDGCRCSGLRPKLTKRETEIFKLLALGQNCKEIAATLSMSDRTVDCHKVNLMTKLKVRRSAHLPILAIQSGLITAADLPRVGLKFIRGIERKVLL